MDRFRNRYNHKDSVPNELFLLKKAFRQEKPAEGSPAGGPEGPAFWVSKSLKTFLGHVGRFVRPSILDLGRANGDNISFLGAQGCRVWVNDFLREQRELLKRVHPGPNHESEEEAEEDSWQETLDGLDYAAGSLQGILCWDSLERMPESRARELVGRLQRLLEPGGVILSFFGSARPGEAQAYKGFRILDPDRIEPVPDAGTHPGRRSYQNAEIMDIFSDFKVLDFFLLKGGYRELLVQKRGDA